MAARVEQAHERVGEGQACTRAGLDPQAGVAAPAGDESWKYGTSDSELGPNLEARARAVGLTTEEAQAIGAKYAISKKASALEDDADMAHSPVVVVARPPPCPIYGHIGPFVHLVEGPHPGL